MVTPALSKGLAGLMSKATQDPSSSEGKTKPMFSLKALVKAAGHTGQSIKDFLVAQGLKEDNLKMAQTYEFLDKHLTTPINRRMMKKLRMNNIFAERAFAGALAIPNFPNLCEAITQIFQDTASNTGGHVADYIPSLARANPEKWGVSICSIHGQQQDWGDVNTRFSIQSTSKPLTYGMALELYGPIRLENHVGFQPSGRRFNETILMQPEGIPHNPCINAGAIMTSAFVKMEPNDTKWDRVDYVMNIWNLLCSDGTDIETAVANFQYSTFLGEQGTAARNNSLAWIGKNMVPFQLLPDTK